MALPTMYEFLEQEGSPPLLVQALRLHGTREVRGARNNPVILEWARELALESEVGSWLDDFYDKDSIPWCGLFVGICAHRAQTEVFKKLLSARAWLEWGEAVDEPELGDVVVLWRGARNGKSGHVGVYVGEDDDCYHLLGGNQGDEVNIKRFTKDRFLGARRLYTGDKPANVRRIQLTATGPVSDNEQ